MKRYLFILVCFFVFLYAPKVEAQCGSGSVCQYWNVTNACNSCSYNWAFQCVCDSVNNRQVYFCGDPTCTGEVGGISQNAQGQTVGLGNGCEISGGTCQTTLDSLGCCVSCTPNWGACSVSCGGGTQSDGCGNTRACNTQSCCSPVDGGWSSWSTCISCSQSRTCTNPKPDCEGAGCSGSSTQSCGYVEGTLSGWVPATCSPICGQTQTRTCSGQCGGDCNDASLSQVCASTDATTPGQVAIVSPNGTVANPTIVTQPVTLQWNNNETNHSYTDVYEFRVYNVTVGLWFTGSAGAGVTVAGGAAATTQVISGLTAGNTYYWQVRAVNNTCNGLPAGITYGAWSAAGYFRINAPPTLNTAPTNFLVIQNSVTTVVPAEAGNRNQICQLIFVEPTATSRQIIFEVTASDGDGGNQITSVGVRLNGSNTVMSDGTVTGNWSLVSPVTNSINGNNRTYTFFMQLDNALNSSTLYSIEAIAEDSYGASSGWVDSTRDLKIWDCNVPVSGTIYEISGTNVCNPGTSIPAAPELNFNFVGFTGVAPAGSTTVAAISDSTYNSPPPLTWGRSYISTLNGDLNGGQPTDVRLNNNPVCNGGLQINITQAVVDAYAANPTLTADFGSIRNQEPWWQVSGGGVVATTAINNNIPITCTGVCIPAMVRQNVAVGNSSDGVILAGGQIDNNSGCDLNTTCFYTSPRNSYRQGSLGNIEISTYTSLYNELFLGAGLGTTVSNWSQIAGQEGLFFVNGPLTIDANNTLGNGRFLMVVVNGAITINDAAVTQVEGIFVSSSMDVSGAAGSPAVDINGVVYTSGNIHTNRDLGGVLNNDQAGVRFNYRPDIIFNMPARITQALSNETMGQ